MSVSDIQEQLCEMYFELTTGTISKITDRLRIDIVAWKNKLLDSVYLIVSMDGIAFKMKEHSKDINKTIYIALGLRKDAKKEVLGL